MRSEYPLDWAAYEDLGIKTFLLRPGGYEVEISRVTAKEILFEHKSEIFHPRRSLKKLIQLVP